MLGCNTELTDIIVEFKGKVESLEPELIPKMFLAKIKSFDGDYEVEMDLHKDLVIYEPGTEIEVTISKDTPEYKEGEDFVGYGTVVSTKEEDGKFAALVSMGGLLFIIRSKKKLNINPVEKVYIKISKL